MLRSFWFVHQRNDLIKTLTLDLNILNQFFLHVHHLLEPLTLPWLSDMYKIQLTSYKIHCKQIFLIGKYFYNLDTLFGEVLLYFVHIAVSETNYVFFIQIVKSACCYDVKIPNRMLSVKHFFLT